MNGCPGLLPSRPTPLAAGRHQYDATCIACHGCGGIGVAPIYLNLGGQKEEYLAAQLKAFRDGSRPNPIMQPMAKGLSDGDIANLAAYLASLNEAEARGLGKLRGAVQPQLRAWVLQ